MKSKLRKVKKDNRQDRFLKVLATVGHISAACKAIKISTVAVHYWRRDDPEFDAKLLAAQEAYEGMLTEEATRRAVKGVEKAIFNKEGEQIGVEIKYSDTLLIFLLKAVNPEKFRDKLILTNESDQEISDRIKRVLGNMVAESQKTIPGRIGVADGGNPAPGSQG